jgi:Arabinose efflux permease
MKFNLKLNTFRAFRSRNYQLYFTGQSVSLIGTWMQRTGVSWVIYTMTHSAFMLGITVFATQFPSFLLSLYGGIISDRYDRYKIMLITQTAAMIQAVLLAVLIYTNRYTVWEILTLSIILGVINAFDMPARQPMVHEIIHDKTDLPNALALNSSMVNLARVLGPALSGIVLQKLGAGICFSINALSFVAVIISLLLMKLPPYMPKQSKKKVSSELLEGFVYLKNTPAIGMILLMLALISLLVLPYNTLLPIFAKIIFKGNAVTFGAINSFIGLGALCGAFFLASLKPGTDLKVILLTNTIIFGVCLMLFSHITNFPLAMVFASVTGFGMMSQTTIGNTIVQTQSVPHMRGRVMSYFALAFFGMLPLGSLLIGTISQQIGAPNTLLCQGLIAIGIAIVFSSFLRKDKLNKRKAKKLEEENVVMKNI